MNKKEMLEFAKINQEKIIRAVGPGYDHLIIGKNNKGMYVLLSDMGFFILEIDINTIADWLTWEEYKPPCTWFM